MKDDVMQVCATCVYGKHLGELSQVICKKNGVVHETHVCKKYKYNIFLPPPPKKRTIDKEVEDLTF